jgi:hypothetical protein
MRLVPRFHKFGREFAEAIGIRPSKLAFNSDVLSFGVTSGEELPLQYMLRVMNDPQADPQRRDYMAKSAAAYVHPRLNSTEVGGKEGSPVVIEIAADEVEY